MGHICADSVHAGPTLRRHQTLPTPATHTPFWALISFADPPPSAEPPCYLRPVGQVLMPFPL